jgi:hypothetical protein
MGVAANSDVIARLDRATTSIKITGDMCNIDGASEKPPELLP